ncbi:DUF2946 family protein [Luteimonas arsenica]|uniref:DUF2946 family protein n=1 Tax=Luteimonas arsenica TaxID=1586242 RepID=UPI001055EA28|nr:DUF2946 family protein [Luteimonas arsenica]
MSARALQAWMGRIGLAAALLLLAVPTVGRFVHASPGAAHVHGQAGHGHAHHSDAADPGKRHPSRPAPGDSDCDYCPLLAAMAALPGVPFLLAALPSAPPSCLSVGAPRLPWLYPTGLGSRGPPLRG